MAIKNGSISQAVVRSPILWGGLATAGFYGLIHAGILSGRLLERYFASHPVEYLATGMFFVGLAALVIRAADVAQQYAAIGRALLGPATPSQGIVGDCEVLLDRLDRLPASRRNDYLVRRLREAIEHVRRRGSADQLEEELRYLADLDADRAAAGFALVRIIIWAIPILGFLGTVIGITLAIANLSPQALEDSLPQVTAGLGVAFDTTALALGLSIVLMFAQFLTDRAQQALLNRVDRVASRAARGRRPMEPSHRNGRRKVPVGPGSRPGQELAAICAAPQRSRTAGSRASAPPLGQGAADSGAKHPRPGFTPGGADAPDRIAPAGPRGRRPSDPAGDRPESQSGGTGRFEEF